MTPDLGRPFVSLVAIISHLDINLLSMTLLQAFLEQSDT